LTEPAALRNTMLKSIPLKIPEVMNPNLSPMFNTAIDLRVGQKFFCEIDGKKVLFLTAPTKFEDQTPLVNELIR